MVQGSLRGTKLARTQVGTPVEHDSAPTSQVLPVLQLAPSRQGMQVAVGLHTMSVPHDAPGGSVPVRTQVGMPVEQSVMPVSQGFAEGEQGVRAVHDTQTPNVLHTLSELGVQRIDEPELTAPAVSKLTWSTTGPTPF